MTVNHLHNFLKQDFAEWLWMKAAPSRDCPDASSRVVLKTFFHVVVGHTRSSLCMQKFWYKTYIDSESRNGERAIYFTNPPVIIIVSYHKENEIFCAQPQSGECAKIYAILLARRAFQPFDTLLCWQGGSIETASINVTISKTHSVVVRNTKPSSRLATKGSLLWSRHWLLT